MPPILLLVPAIITGVLLIAAGLWAERRKRPAPARSAIRPIQPPAPAQMLQPPEPTLAPNLRHAGGLWAHPDPLLALLKTAFWGVMLVAMVDHLGDVRYSTTAHLAWLLTIVPHEAGHFICVPFGHILNIAGGSIWQVLLYVLLAGYAALFRRQTWLALVFVAIAGHSLINLSVYIEDAAERDLPLIFGMNKSHHDWWNLLSHYDALHYDDRIAAWVLVSGAAIVVIAALAGIVTAWRVPLPPPPEPGYRPRGERSIDALLGRDADG